MEAVLTGPSNVIQTGNTPLIWPGKTYQAFCHALLAGDRQLAVNQLSTNLQNRQGSLVIEALVLNKTTTCAYTPAIIKGSSATATLTVTSPLNEAAGSSQNKAPVTLIQEAKGLWKIDALQGL